MCEIVVATFDSVAKADLSKKVTFKLNTEDEKEPHIK